VLGTVKLIILARLLSPTDFGIIGIAVLSVNVLNVFSETGVEAALIQRDKIARAELDTAWTLAVVRGFILFTLLFLSAGWIASYFDYKSLKPILRVMSVSFILGGFTNIGIVYFQKELNFQKKAILDSIADISGAVSAIILALYIRNVWALVAGAIIWVTVKCLASYWLHPYRPKISWDWPVAKSLLNFGKHIFWVSLVTFIVTCGDDALVGKLMGVTMLGFYTMAYNIANIPVSSLTAIISKISFPAYSLLQKDPERLKEAFKKIFEIVLIILLPLTVLIILLAKDFTSIFLGDKWLSMVPVLRILCLLGLFRGLANVFAPIQLAVNRPNIQSRNKTLELILFLTLVYPFTSKWGLTGAAWAVTLVYFASAIVNALSSASLVSALESVLLKASWPPLLATLGLISSTWLVQSLFATTSELFRFALAVITGFFVFAMIIVTLRRTLLRDILTGALGR